MVKTCTLCGRTKGLHLFPEKNSDICCMCLDGHRTATMYRNPTMERKRWLKKVERTQKNSIVAISNIGYCKFNGCDNIFVKRGKTYYCSKCQKKAKREYQRIYSMKYRKTEKGREAFKSLIRKRRAKINDIEEVYTNEEWLSLLHGTMGICPKCKKYVGVENLSLDHIYPISKAEIGRIYTIEDIQPLCKSCNSSKSNKIPKHI